MIYGVDKYKAVHNKWRIPETTLLVIAVIGVIGAFAGKKILCDKFVCVFADGAVAELRFCRFVCSYFFAELRKRSLLKSIFVL